MRATNHVSINGFRPPLDRPPQDRPGASTRQPQNSKRAHLRALALQKTPPKFHEKTPREGRKERIVRREREKKERNSFGAPPFGPTLLGSTLPDNPRDPRETPWRPPPGDPPPGDPPLETPSGDPLWRPPLETSFFLNQQHNTKSSHQTHTQDQHGSAQTGHSPNIPTPHVGSPAPHREATGKPHQILGIRGGPAETCHHPCCGTGQEGTPTKGPRLFHSFPQKKPLGTRSVMGQTTQE